MSGKVRRLPPPPRPPSAGPHVRHPASERTHAMACARGLSLDRSSWRCLACAAAPAAPAAGACACVGVGRTGMAGGRQRWRERRKCARRSGGAGRTPKPYASAAATCLVGAESSG